jgi:large subunit ribosomal protein L11
MIVKLLVEGGAMAPGPVLAQKLGPLGINMGKVISDVNVATAEFKGTKVPVELNIDTSTKQFTISVKSPPIPELIKKELGITVGSGDHKKLQVGNLAIEQAIKVAKIKLPEMLEKDLKAALKTVVGSCVSLGVLVESKPAKQVAKEIQEGVYDNEIKSEKTQPSPEKLQELNEFFTELNTRQESQIKKQKDEADAKEAKGKKKADAVLAAPAAKVGAKTAAKPAAKTAAKPAAKKK